MADEENIALGRPAQHKGPDRYPTSGASRAVDGVFDGGTDNKNGSQVRLVGVMIKKKGNTFGISDGLCIGHRWIPLCKGSVMRAS